MGFTEAIKSDGFSLIAEVDPPKGVDTGEFLDSVLSIRGRVAGVLVTDGSYAVMRMTPLAPCRLLVERSIQPAMTLNGRDRNRISFQGDLLAAWALGVRDLLITEGRDPAVGDQPLARSSGDLDREVMLRCAMALNEGKDLAGEPLQGGTDFFVGAALGVSDDIHVNRTTAESIPRLVEQGVGYLVLGPTYDRNIIDLLTEAGEKAGVPVLASVMLLKSVTMIRYLNNLPGVPNVPHEFLRQMMEAPVKSQAGMEVAANFVKDLEKRCRGAVLIALGWGARLPEFLEQMGH
jgi:5,10-methylenetetrahydrofolate reductase